MKGKDFLLVISAFGVMIALTLWATPESGEPDRPYDETCHSDCVSERE